MAELVNSSIEPLGDLPLFHKAPFLAACIDVVLKLLTADRDLSPGKAGAEEHDSPGEALKKGGADVVDRPDSLGAVECVMPAIEVDDQPGSDEDHAEQQGENCDSEQREADAAE